MHIPQSADACVEDVFKLGLSQVEVGVIRPLLQKTANIKLKNLKFTLNVRTNYHT